MSPLICQCSTHKWHFKDPTDSGTCNATQCKTLFSSVRTFLLFPSLTTQRSLFQQWDELSANITSTVCCSLLSTIRKSSTDLQSANRDRGTSNSTAPATVVLKIRDDWSCPPLLHPPLCPSPSSKPKWLFYICSCQSLRSSCVQLHTYAHVGKLTALLCDDMSLPLTVSCTGIEQSHPPMCAVCSHTWQEPLCAIV